MIPIITLPAVVAELLLTGRLPMAPWVVEVMVISTAEDMEPKLMPVRAPVGVQVVAEAAAKTALQVELDIRALSLSAMLSRKAL